MAAQQVTVTGLVVDQESKLGIENARVVIVGTHATTQTGITGLFVLQVTVSGRSVVSVSMPGYQDLQLEIAVPETGTLNLGELSLRKSATADLDDLSLLPVISLDAEDADIDGQGDGQDISSILTASRDVFVSTASFTFGPARFRIRGYSPDYSELYVNGVPFNDAETGVPYFWQLGGLNDVLRNRDINIGLTPVSYGFGDIGGASNIDVRASRQRAETRLSYAVSNRSYDHRIMLTHSTGILSNGWSFSFSGSRRWAQEGYIEGTFYDAWSYFAGVEKRINNRHSLGLSVFGAPTIRGGSGPAIQEMYDLSGSNYYNPNWGFQNGEKRNARVSNAHLPMAILRHDFSISRRATLTTSLSYQAGRNGFGALAWDGPNDPRPDYYQKLPSFQRDPALAAEVAELLRRDQHARQLNWDSFYEANKNNERTITDVGGIPGNTATGLFARYFIEERRIDNKVWNFSSFYENFLSDRLSLNAGVAYRHFTGENFKVVSDLLGADYYLNEDRFARRDFPNNPEKWRSDLNDPNTLLQAGDRLGYDYLAQIRHGHVWGQATYKLPRWDFFLSAKLAGDRMWREGRMRNGLFPEDSYGESETVSFLTWQVKGGATYKLDGRQYLYVHAMSGTASPLYRNVFVSPRTRDQVNPYARPEKTLSGEAGYLFRSPNIKARASIYYTRFSDQSTIVSYFQDEGSDFDEDGTADVGGLVNFVLNGIEKTHMGTELAIEYKVSPSVSLTGVASLGDFRFSNRPQAYVVFDNSNRPLADGLPIFVENYFVSRTPQQAYSVGINYRSSRFWFLNVNINYFGKSYLDFNPLRRTAQAVSDIDYNSPEWHAIVDQELLPSAVTVDLFGGKSWKFGKHYIYLNVGIGNLLNNRNFITGGYEQLRFDFTDQNPARFPPKYFYAYGFNYFANISYKF